MLSLRRGFLRVSRFWQQKKKLTPCFASVLVAQVGAGIAFHHSGLVVEERSILEEAFRQGSIR